jgi:type I phosphodiesterase / nucleotide pyrophosphatase family protein
MLNDHLRATGASLPSADDFRLTQVIPAVMGAVEPELSLARPDLSSSLGLERAKAAVVILVDGLGLIPLMDHLGHARNLRGFRDQIHTAYSVVPSTTAAGITACGTGQLPGRTRMVGYSVLHGERLFNLLAFTDGIDPTQWQECPTFFEQLSAASVPCATILPAKFAGSGLTSAALRGARFVPATSWEERCQAAIDQIRSGTKLVYLYWSDIDAAGHAHGVGSGQWSDALEDFDAGLGRFLSLLPDDVRVVLTADHGMVNIDFDQLYNVAELSPLSQGVRAVAGETRAVHVHCLPGTNELQVRNRWEEFLGEHAWVVGADELPELIGTGPGLAESGDFVVFSRGRRGIVDSRTQSSGAMTLIGVHGSLTPDEMLIPLAVLA